MASRARRAALAVTCGAAGVMFAAAPAGAQVPNPPPDPSIPGSELIRDVLGWLKYGALAAAVAGLLLGGIATGIGYSSSHYGASALGRRWLLGGLGAAIIAGLAHTVAITLYRAT